MLTASRKRILLASIPITPTKPFTPSHVKGLLWLDTLYKATSALHDVNYLHNRMTCDAALQTVGFWAYLDELFPGFDYDGVTESWIGDRYVAYNQARETIDDRPQLRRYIDRVLHEGFLHPASRALLRIWQDQYARLGLHDPGLFRSSPVSLSSEATIERLEALGVGLDARRMGSGVYLDLSADGMPLRQIIGADGTPIYLFHALRELLGIHRDYDCVVLLCDDELLSDYLLVQRVLERAGTPTARLSLGRVPIGGVIASARHGGFEAHSFDRVFGPLFEGFAPEAVRLGARLYFVAGLGRGSGQDFRAETLRHFVARAQKILRSAGPRAPTATAAPEFIARLTQPIGCVDPYRFVAQLMARRTGADATAFICSVLSS